MFKKADPVVLTCLGVAILFLGGWWPIQEFITGWWQWWGYLVYVASWAVALIIVAAILTARLLDSYESEEHRYLHE